jgi:hypothetical protein
MIAASRLQMATKIRGSLKEPNCITSSPLTHPESKPANALAGYLKPFVGHCNCWSFPLRVPKSTA